ncbi:P-loop containing nucleoside triphosphate hydrolase protein [Stachybotrys elegans]|uniref:P-loop containing nucleoside triphosphate hydrolase protein n=1 Tax=Stachybotrys elegans TaxID=80388 RepID=A0A8K0WXD0_9HYPO|nr:P-loop containing nucleoside triphosphate hydrolase protein [Stachybotrys elegans]
MSQIQLPLVVSGPSGVGKGTLISRLRAQHPDAFSLSRATMYHFVSATEFQALIDEKAFLEHTCFSGNHYGSGKILILDIDMNGIQSIRDMGPDFAVRCAFISPPNLKALEDRLRNRGTETEASIRQRLAQAEREMAFAETRGPDDMLIINHDLDDAYKRLEEFALGLQQR